MYGWRKAKRVRLHMIDQGPQPLPSIEGLLISRRHREYLIAMPQLHMAVGADPAVPESQMLAVPREHVAFYEVIKS